MRTIESIDVRKNATFSRAVDPRSDCRGKRAVGLADESVSRCWFDREVKPSRQKSKLHEHETIRKKSHYPSILRSGDRRVGSIWIDDGYLLSKTFLPISLNETIMANMKIIKGARHDLEYELLAALFTPGADATAESLKQQLAPRGKGQIRAVSTSASSMTGKSSPSSRPTEEGDET